MKTKKGVTLLVNKLDKYEWFNHEEWKVLVNQSIPHLLPVAVEQKGRRMILSVTMERMVPVSDYLSRGQDVGTILTFIWRTVKIAWECERHGLRIGCLCWEHDKIFVDQSSGDLAMIYWPVTGLNQNSQDALMYYKSYMPILSQRGLDTMLLSEYSAYFYQRDHFDAHGFYGLMDGLMKQWRKRQSGKSGSHGQEPEYKAEVLNSPVVITGCLERCGEQTLLVDQVTTFGRDRSMCNVEIVGDAFVSRCHARIIHQDGRFFLVDLGSANGTFINEYQLKSGETRELFDGVQVRFGGTAYTFRLMRSTKTMYIHR